LPCGPSEHLALHEDLQLSPETAALAARAGRVVHAGLPCQVDRPQRLWLTLRAGASVEGDPGIGTALHTLARTHRKNADAGAGGQAA
jgi:hypothetical protein